MTLSTGLLEIIIQGGSFALIAFLVVLSLTRMIPAFLAALEKQRIDFRDELKLVREDSQKTLATLTEVFLKKNGNSNHGEQGK